MTEIEIKLKTDLHFIGDLLKNPHFRLKKATFQKTVRMDTENEELEKRGVFIRTREDTDLNKNTITLKRKITNASENVFTREEFETQVGDGSTIIKILDILGLTKSWILEKYRIEGEFGKVTVCIDELPFGLYIEIEGEEGDIFNTCEQLGIDTSDKIVVTYWDLWEEYKKLHNETGDNIVFGNKNLVLKNMIKS